MIKKTTAHGKTSKSDGSASPNKPSLVVTKKSSDKSAVKSQDSTKSTVVKGAGKINLGGNELLSIS
jgi:hypothetical protein